MTTLPLINLLDHLNRQLTPQQRYQAMVKAIQQSAAEAGIQFDAIALLKLEGDALRPIATIGLKGEVFARRFKLSSHPRLQIILENNQPTRFTLGSALPDPYDGLIESDKLQLRVHECMGSAIYIDNKPWGVLTLDAIDATVLGAPESLNRWLNMTVITSIIKTFEYIETLESRAQHQHEITQRLLVNELTPEIIGHSPVVKAMLQEIDIVAPTELTVLITGETGVGKELVARSIHQYSKRSDKPLVQLNCAALAENIIESELFGHLRGAFSGATSDRTGRFELADGGTLFLDEVGELPLLAQAKLLRAIQSGDIQRVGSDKDISVDVRIIAATNRDLKQEVQEGRFRADLYHRLSVYPLPVPPLRERERDSELLAGFFLEKYQHQLGLTKLRLSSAARAQLQAYDWPGNVRELEHLLNRAALKAMREQGRNSSLISIDKPHLDLHIKSLPVQNIATDVADFEACTINETGGFKDRVADFQRQLIERALLNNNGNHAAAARELKLDRSNLMRTVKRLENRT